MPVGLPLVAASSPWLAAWEQTLRDGNKRIETLIVCSVFTAYRHHRPRCPVSWVSRGNINPPSSTTHCSQCHVSPPLRWNCSRILALTILLNSVWRGIRGENVRIAIKNFRLINPESGKIFDSIVRASSSQHYDSLSLCGGEWFILWRKSYLFYFYKASIAFMNIYT